MLEAEELENYGDYTNAYASDDLNLAVCLTVWCITDKRGGFVQSGYYIRYTTENVIFICLRSAVFKKNDL